MKNFSLTILATSIAFLSTAAVAQPTGKDTISGVYEAKNRFAQFEKMKNGDVKFYISGMEIGSRYPCTIGGGSIGEDGENIGSNPAFLKMNGPTGGYSDNTHVISVEFGKNTAKVIVGKSTCIVDGVYKMTGGKNKVSWTGGGD